MDKCGNDWKTVTIFNLKPFFFHASCNHDSYFLYGRLERSLSFHSMTTPDALEDSLVLSLCLCDKNHTSSHSPLLYDWVGDSLCFLLQNQAPHSVYKQHSGADSGRMW